ncbi:MAG: hypothetical protein WEB62_03720 [Bacteroidota bacterium]
MAYVCKNGPENIFRRFMFLKNICRAGLLIPILFLACKSPLEAFEGPGLHVLFIGNSLTYVNDLPRTLQRVMNLGGREMSYHSVANPDFSLADHLAGGSDAVKQIQRGGWDFVIMQQGPSSLPESRTLLIGAVQTFNAHIRAVGARTALYMVWPDKSRLSFFEDVRVSYKLAADTVGGLFLPAGEAWLEAWKLDSTLTLYWDDDFHPSYLGTYLASLVIYELLTGAVARDLPNVVVVADQNFGMPDLAEQLQEAASATVAKY